LPVYELAVNGEKFRLEVSRKNEKKFEVKIDGREPIEIAVEGSLNRGEAFKLDLGEKTYTVELGEISRSKPFQVKVNDYPFTVEFKRPTFQPKTKAAAATVALTAGKTSTTVLAVPEGAVVAPMTGKIVSVKVKEGDSVKRGDVLCVLEAMKMENEISAPRDGVVREVHVSEGSAVSEGEVLFVVEQH